MSVLLALVFSVQIAIIVAGGILVLIALVSNIIVPETKFIRLSHATAAPFAQMKHALTLGLSQIKRHRMLRYIAWVTLFIGLASEGFDRLWGAHIIEGFELNEEHAVYWFGALFAIAYILNILLLGWIERHVTKSYATVLFLLNALLMIALITFAYSDQFFVAVAFYWVISALRETNEPVLAVMINQRLSSKGRATTLSMFGQVDALGQIAGGPIIGLLALYASVADGIAATALLLLPVVLCCLWMRRLY